MKARGFSLLEAMVTLVIVSFVATILAQSLVHLLALRERVRDHDAAARAGLLHERWFRDTVSAAIADELGMPGAFEGGPDWVRLQTQNPLRGDGIDVVEWRLAGAPGQKTLEYTQGGQSWVVVAGRWQEPRFRFLDRKGRWHDAWPVADAKGEYLPRAVSLEAEANSGPTTWLVAMAADGSLPMVLRIQEGAGAF